MINPPVELRQSELDRVSEIPGIDFQVLPLHLKRRLATFVLMERADEKSVGIARLIAANNPNITYFTVIDDVRNPQVSRNSQRVRRLDTMRR
jgi:hypothetical protein